MTPSDFPQSNGTLQKPPTMTDEECSPLKVHRALSHNAYISCWRPTWRERLAILFGSPVWLWVYGERHPPVALDTTTFKWRRYTK